MQLILPSPAFFTLNSPFIPFHFSEPIEYIRYIASFELIESFNFFESISSIRVIQSFGFIFSKDWVGVCRASQAKPAASPKKQTLSPHSKSKAGGLRGPTGQRTGKNWIYREHKREKSESGAC